ncbi:MAG: hypothetical protein U0793_27615 [Gemmataceae bacterium]
MSTLLLLVAGLPLGGTPAAGGRDDSFFRFEAKGVLSVRLDPNDKKIVGVTFRCPKFTIFGRIDVTLPEKKEIHELAKKLSGQKVILTGTAALVVEPPMDRLIRPAS